MTVTQNADLFICADLLDVSADNDIAEFLVQFDGTMVQCQETGER